MELQSCFKRSKRELRGPREDLTLVPEAPGRGILRGFPRRCRLCQRSFPASAPEPLLGAVRKGGAPARKHN
eukprot:9192398-Alexandrium_andersonii.AAC.1